MVYEKTRLLSGSRGSREDDGEAEDCDFCERPKSVVYCGNCSFRVANLRVRKKCSKHPQVINTMDLAVCPKCKSTNLLENGIDKIPSKGPALKPVASALSPNAPPFTLNLAPKLFESGMKSISPSVSPMSPVSPLPSAIQVNVNGDCRGMPREPPTRAVPTTMGSSFTNGPESMSSLGSRSTVSGNGNNAPAKRLSRVNLPVALSPTPPAPPPQRLTGPCVCQRTVIYIVCGYCGFHNDKGQRKYIPCPQHPNAKTGIKFCPDCGKDAAKFMDEGVLR